jgi:alginate O-acetyltransferase complex protein AlgJ
MVEGGLESLRKGLIHTDITPTMAKWITGLFMAGIILVPLAQIVFEVIRPDEPVRELGLFAPHGTAMKELASGDVEEAWNQLKFSLSKDHLDTFENDLKEGSIFRRVIQPRVQTVFTKYLGFGNAGSVVARENFFKPNGWLYYQLGIDYLAGPGMLEKDFIHAREAKYYNEGEEDVCADPRKAIIQFHKDCVAAGVHLVFVPVPVKPALQPGELRGKALKSAVAVAQNRDYERFVADLRAAGVDVFDEYIPKTVEPGQEPLFLEQDTHWTPQWMEVVAKQVADHVKKKVTLPAPASPFEVIVEEAEAARVGDIVDTLKLPKNQTLFEPQEVTINRVLDAKTKEERPWREDSDVLFIGDSFSNIFSAPQMGWGDAAGFANHISRHLGRDLDAMIENGESASGIREKLAERAHPLKGKRVVIWEVAMHELTCSNWKVIEMQADSSSAEAGRLRTEEPVAGR